jgi:hypothetical protein
MQVEAGMIPESNLQRLEWMYNDRSSMQKTNEDYLLGKPVNHIEPIDAQP